ncbi:MAG: OsmC family protein [Chloroflexota bacterium]
MSEKVIVRQNKNFEIGFWVADPEQTKSEHYSLVRGFHEVTPYAMLLISLAACTAQVVLVYARNHGIGLEEVEFRLAYDRVYREDCENCEQIERYEEQIYEQIEFFGDLQAAEKDKLFHIAHQCPIEKMLKQGIRVHSERI